MKREAKVAPAQLFEGTLRLEEDLDYRSLSEA